MKKTFSIIGGFCLLFAASAKGAESGQWDVFEASYTTTKSYSNAFSDIEVNVVFGKDGKQWVVPAFWADGKKWIVRFAPPQQGSYSYHVECSDKTNADLNGKEKILRVGPYLGRNPLIQHGFIQVASGGRHFEQADRTPFLWLGDTWWKGLCKRLTWDGFQELTADRKAKGFSVVQIVCGPYPDEDAFSPSLENEGGMPYRARDFSIINTSYFDYADRRIQHLVEAGIVPAMVGAWGRSDCDAMQVVGTAGLKKHWRNLVARYGAYPVVWILAGEIEDRTTWGEGPWAEVASYVRSIDPYHHPLTCHTYPGKGRRGFEGDISEVDFELIGGSHDAPTSVAAETLAMFVAACEKYPPMPALCGETCYEGHMQQGFGDTQRHLFWMYMLNGAAGHTYGAAGVWHAGVEGDPGVASSAFGVHRVYDWTTWKEGMQYAGSKQLGLGKKLLEEYSWWQFEPHPEWVEPGCFAAGIPGQVRFIYRPRRNVYNWSGPIVRNLEKNVDWHAFYFDPATGRRFDLGPINAKAKGGPPTNPTFDFENDLPSPQDWILVLEAIRAPTAR